MQKIRRTNKKYSPEFKLSVIMDMRENHLSYNDTVRKYWGVESRTDCSKHRSQVRCWERIYLEEGEKGFMTERRGRKSTGRPKKNPVDLDAEVKEDLITENQRLKEQLEYLEMENAYLKKLDALVRAREQQNKKSPK